MDQIRIGKFIARTRKENHLTQRQLADCLSISDKTVSKWECGKGLPEASLRLCADTASSNKQRNARRVPAGRCPCEAIISKIR